MIGALILLVLGVSRQTTSSAALDAPRNVRLTSFNMNLQLEWDPPEGAADDLLYSTQFRPRQGGPTTPGCTDTPQLSCDLSRSSRPVTQFAAYVGSVRAQRGSQTSNWTDSNDLTLFKDTVIGPPGLVLLSRGASLEVVITDPEFLVSTLRYTFPDATYNLSYWREGEQQDPRVEIVQQNRLFLSDLQPWTKYCAEVRVQTAVASTSQPSSTVCQSTSSEEAAPWVAAAVTAAIMLVLVALLVATVVHRRRISRLLCSQKGIPEHLKQYLLAPPTNSSPVAWHSPPPEVYDEVCIVADPEAQHHLESPCSDVS